MRRPERPATEAPQQARASDGREPLGLLVSPLLEPAGSGGARALRIEFSSRGDRVPGRLLLPPPPRSARARADAGSPAVALVRGAADASQLPALERMLPWVRAGAAVACIDLPLHGERRSAKLTERLLCGPGPWPERPHPDVDPLGRLLWTEFERQAEADLERLFDALATLSDVDPARSAYVGCGLAASLGARFLERDPRPRAAALVFADAGSRAYARRWPARGPGSTGRPLLFVRMRGGEPEPSTDALFDAAPEPKTVAWFEAGGADPTARALDAAWPFLRAQLGLEANPLPEGG